MVSLQCITACYVNMGIVTLHIHSVSSIHIDASNKNIQPSNKLTKFRIATMNFGNMTNIRVGVFPTSASNVTHCMKHGLEREFKMDCHKIPGMWPNGAGALLFFLVRWVLEKM